MQPRLRQPGGRSLAGSPVCTPPPPQPGRPFSGIPAPRPALARRRPWFNPFLAGRAAENEMKREPEGSMWTASGRASEWKQRRETRRAQQGQAGYGERCALGGRTEEWRESSPSQFRLSASLVLLISPGSGDVEAGRWGGPGVHPLKTHPSPSPSFICLMQCG